MPAAAAVASRHCDELTFVPPLGITPPPDVWAKRLTQVTAALQREAWLCAAWREHAPDHANTAPAAVAGSAAAAPWHLNALIGERSPYLLQHATQPIDWIPLAAGSRAESETPALRLVSIGYSTCHWCQVMAQQSFADPAVARLLNAAFASIKVDREQHPEVDARYQRLQRRVSGEAGWPVTVIETAAGQPLFVGSFVDRDALIRLLTRLRDLQATAPATLAALASSLAEPAESGVGPATAASEPPDRRLPGLDDLLDQHWDGVHGGLQGAQKFPDPGLFEWLLEDADGAPGDRIGAALQQQLQGMIGGLFDPLEGGFFRYATRNDWRQPHFEKMLYTQAQLIQWLARAGQGLARADWIELASDTLAFSDRRLLDQRSGLFRSAIDARWHGSEGGYYRLPRAQAAALAAALPGLQAYPSAPGAVLAIDPTALVGSSLPMQLADWRQRLPARPLPFVDGKQLTAWNAAMARALLALAEAAGNPELRQRAQSMLETLWQRFEPDSGTLWRDQYGGAEAALEDMVELGWAQLELARELPAAAAAATRARAHALAERAARNYLQGPGAAHWHDLLDDGERPAPAPALCALLTRLLHQAYRDPLAELEAQCWTRLAAAAPAAGASRWSQARWLSARSHGGVDRSHAVAEGHGQLRLLRAGRERAITLELALEPGWHVNARGAGKLGLIPLQISLAGLGAELEAHYPEPDWRSFPFAATALPVHQGRLRIDLETADTALIEVRLQACSETLCLLPERRLLRLW